mmetsp:Transcript_94269/g.282666  ORF Transcript_94269/g.282666 Transcript_94269/m.282666 type:complete len:266 (+) Transcript_94269:239-1036(+)
MRLACWSGPHGVSATFRQCRRSCVGFRSARGSPPAWRSRRLGWDRRSVRRSSTRCCNAILCRPRTSGQRAMLASRRSRASCTPRTAALRSKSWSRLPATSPRSRVPWPRASMLSAPATAASARAASPSPGSTARASWRARRSSAYQGRGGGPQACRCSKTMRWRSEWNRSITTPRCARRSSGCAGRWCWVTPCPASRSSPPPRRLCPTSTPRRCPPSSPPASRLNTSRRLASQTQPAAPVGPSRPTTSARATPISSLAPLCHSSH